MKRRNFINLFAVVPAISLAPILKLLPTRGLSFKSYVERYKVYDYIGSVGIGTVNPIAELHITGDHR